MTTPRTEAPATTTVALKEWGAVVHALLQGRQRVLLRKGGIHEKAFAVDGDPGGFVLFPTVAHSHWERVRSGHQDLLPLGEADVSEERFTVRCGVRLAEVVEVTRPEALPELADLHIWTDASVQEDRVDFRPRHPLQVLVVDAYALPEPVTLPRLAEHGGCRSWVEVAYDWRGEGQRVHDDAALAAVAARVRETIA